MEADALPLGHGASADVYEVGKSVRHGRYLSTRSNELALTTGIPSAISTRVLRTPMAPRRRGQGDEAGDASSGFER